MEGPGTGTGDELAHPTRSALVTAMTTGRALTSGEDSAGTGGRSDGGGGWLRAPHGPSGTHGLRIATAAEPRDGRGDATCQSQFFTTLWERVEVNVFVPWWVLRPFPLLKKRPGRAPWPASLQHWHRAGDVAPVVGRRGKKHGFRAPVGHDDCPSLACQAAFPSRVLTLKSRPTFTVRE